MKYALALILAVASPLAFASTAIGVDSLVELVIYLIIIGGVFWLLLFLIGYIGLPEPFSKVAKAIIMIVAVLILINVLLGFAGHPIYTLR